MAALSAESPVGSRHWRTFHRGVVLKGERGDAHGDDVAVDERTRFETPSAGALIAEAELRARHAAATKRCLLSQDQQAQDRLPTRAAT
jgi:hypothetical protein